MDTPEEPQQPRTVGFSREARLGTGITIAGLGFLGLLLAWAEKMRAVSHVAAGWLVVGAILMIAGCIIAASGRTGK